MVGWSSISITRIGGFTACCVAGARVMVAVLVFMPVLGC
jgi:hypothetical protein